MFSPSQFIQILEDSKICSLVCMSGISYSEKEWELYTASALDFGFMDLPITTSSSVSVWV